MSERIFHWVRHHELADWLACGWCVAKFNAPMHHHEYSLLCEWLCDCKPVMIPVVTKPRKLIAPPDLQMLVANHGSYDRITPRAWAEYDAAIAEWKDRLRDGTAEIDEPAESDHNRANPVA
jgi:hypothetical protein